MTEYIKIALEFIFIFSAVFCYYNFIIINKKKELTKDNLPPELNILIKKYNLDSEKINYKKTMRVVSIFLSFDIALIFFLISLVDNLLLKLLICLIAIFVLIFITYKVLGFIYKKKGLIKDV